MDNDKNMGPIKLETAHYSSLAVFSPYSDWNDFQDTAVFFAPKTLKTTDIRFGVAAGAYKPIVSTVSIVSMKTIRRSDGGWSFEVLVSYPKKYEKMDVSLEAWTASGKLLDTVASDDESKMDKNGTSTRWFRLSGESSAKPSRFRLSVRPYCWATFKGIHLYPNMKIK